MNLTQVPWERWRLAGKFIDVARRRDSGGPMALSSQVFTFPARAMD